VRVRTQTGRFAQTEMCLYLYGMCPYLLNDPTAGEDYRLSYADFLSLSPNSKPNECKVIVISTEAIDTKNAQLISDINNS